MQTNPNPTGQEMIERSRRVYDKVKEILISYPQTRGDHMLLYIMVLRKYYWRLVRITTKPTLILEFASFDSFFKIPAAETVRRRAQECQHAERERIWGIVAERYPGLVTIPDPLDKNINPNEWRKNETCKAEFMKIAKTSQLLPTERVIRKRWRNETAHVHEYTDQQMSLGDVWNRN